MIAQVRMAFRLQRFEVVAAIVAVAIVAISALVVRVRLESVGVPESCWQAWMASGFGEGLPGCSDLIFQWGLINGEEAAKVIVAMAILPFVLGLFLGVPLVGREIEGRTAPTVWALSGSRIRWLVGRLMPILLLLVVLLIAMAVTSDLLWIGRSQWRPIPNFDDAGLHGWTIVAKGLAAFGVALIVGTVIGRLLPAIIVTIALILAGSTLAAIMMDAWLQSEAKEHTAPASEIGVYDESLYPGGTYFSQAWLGPNGEILFSQEEALLLVPAGTDDPETWIYENVPVVQMGVPGTSHAAYERYESMLFGVVALGALMLIFPIVQRRRPM